MRWFKVLLTQRNYLSGRFKWTCNGNCNGIESVRKGFLDMEEVLKWESPQILDMEEAI